MVWVYSISSVVVISCVVVVILMLCFPFSVVIFFTIGDLEVVVFEVHIVTLNCTQVQ